MKANALLIAALLLIGSTISTVAKEDPRNARHAVVPVKGSSIIKVIYKADVSSKIKIHVYNSASQIVFSEIITSEGFIRPLNFSGLQPGEYTIELTEGSNKIVEKVVYNPHKAAAVTKRIVHVSRVSDDNKYLVSIKDAAGEKITLRFYDIFNNLVYSESREVTGEFAQVYWLKNHKNVTVEVTDENGNSKYSRF